MRNMNYLHKNGETRKIIKEKYYSRMQNQFIKLAKFIQIKDGKRYFKLGERFKCLYSSLTQKLLSSLK